MTGPVTIDLCFVWPDASTSAEHPDEFAEGMRVQTLEDPDVESIESLSPDCVLVGTGVSMSDRCEFVASLWGCSFDGPVVVRVWGDEPAEKPLDAGATDVLAGAEVGSAVLTNRIENVVEQHQNRERANRQEDRIQSLLEHSTDRLSVLDEQGNYEFVSPSFERLLGFEEDELVGASGFEFIHPDDRDRVERIFKRLVEDADREEAVEYRVRDVEGTWRWVRSHGTNRLDDPSIEGIVVNSTEITDQRRRQQELEEERAFTESIFAALPDVFYAFDERGNFLRWNERFSEVTGYSDAEIEQMQPVEFIAPADRERVANAIARSFDGETVTVEARFLTKGGDELPYEFTGAKVTDNMGETIGLVGIGRDISASKRRQRRFEAVFNNTYQFTGLMEPDGTLLEVNAAALEFGGLDRANVVGKKLWDAHWFQTSDRAREVARESVAQAKQGKLYRQEIEVQGDRSSEVIDFSVRPITDDSGAVTLLVPEGRTITDLKQREQHLKVLHRFLRHNLRNKMTVINGTTNLLQKQLDGPEYQKQLSQIRSASAELIQLSETARELLDLTINTSADLRALDPDPLVSRVAQTVRDDHPDAEVEVVSECSSLVNADWRLESVLEQLAENAVVHSEADHPKVDIELIETNDRVVIRIVDDGPQIPDDELSVLLGAEDPSQLTHGTGFGLWMVRYVIDKYGGSVGHEYADGGNVMNIDLGSVGEGTEIADGAEESGQS